MNALLAEEPRRRRALEHSKQLNADPLESNEQATTQFSTDFRLCPPTPAYQTPPERAQKQQQQKKHTHKLDQTDDKEGIRTHPVEEIMGRKWTFSILPIQLHDNWPQYGP